MKSVIFGLILGAINYIPIISSAESAMEPVNLGPRYREVNTDARFCYERGEQKRIPHKDWWVNEENKLHILLEEICSAASYCNHYLELTEGWDYLQAKENIVLKHKLGNVALVAILTNQTEAQDYVQILERVHQYELLIKKKEAEAGVPYCDDLAVGVKPEQS